MGIIHSFSCGCDIIRISEWEWRIIMCMSHKRNEDRITHLAKEIMEPVHP